MSSSVGVLLAVTFGVGACSSASDNQREDSGVKDGAPAVADVSVHDGKQLQDASSGADRGDVGGCYVVTGTGPLEQCAFSSRGSGESGCGSSSASMAGSCPSLNLYGCCVLTQQADGATPQLTATCYYAVDAGAAAQSQCEDNAYEGIPAGWHPHAP